MSVGSSFPEPTGERRSNPGAVRTVLFWATMIFLAVLLWKVASPPSSKMAHFSSAELQSEIDKKNIRSAYIIIFPERTSVRAERKNSSSVFQAYVSNDITPKIIAELQGMGADVSIRGSADAQNNWISFLLDGVPFIFLIAVFILMMKRQRQRDLGGRGNV